MCAWMSLYAASGKSAGIWIPTVLATMLTLTNRRRTRMQKKADRFGLWPQSDPERGLGRDLLPSNRRRNRATVEFPATQSKRQSAREIICMGAYKGHFSIICAVCMRLIQPGKEGSETIVGVCDDCRTQSQIEGKTSSGSPASISMRYRRPQNRMNAKHKRSL